MSKTIVCTLKPPWLSKGFVGVPDVRPNERSRSKIDWMSA
jgi:hypothetical protein